MRLTVARLEEIKEHVKHSHSLFHKNIEKELLKEIDILYSMVDIATKALEDVVKADKYEALYPRGPGIAEEALNRINKMT